MAKQLKQIILNIARLSDKDQRWILRQLPDAQLAILKQHQGFTLLKEARRFKKIPEKIQIKTAKLPQIKPAATLLPDFCQELASMSPLYSAIILEQGKAPWSAAFLDQFDLQGTIKKALTHQVPDLKSIVKEAVFNEWELNHSFAAYMEAQHG